LIGIYVDLPVREFVYLLFVVREFSIWARLFVTDFLE